MTANQCSELLDLDLKWTRAAKDRLFGKIKCECANAVAVDMIYNMGERRMSQFKSLIWNFKTKHYDKAAK